MKTIIVRENSIKNPSNKKPIASFEKWLEKRSPQTFSFPNQYGSFTSVKLILRGKERFLVETTVRAKEKDSGNIRIKMFERLFDKLEYKNFIDDLKNRI